jgi:hypothetical protein
MTTEEIREAASEIWEISFRACAEMGYCADVCVYRADEVMAAFKANHPDTIPDVSVQSPEPQQDSTEDAQGGTE